MWQNNELLVDNYWNAMFDELNELKQESLDALENIVRQKESLSRYYNNCVKNKTLQFQGVE